MKGFFFFVFLFSTNLLISQEIGDFISVEPIGQSSSFVIPQGFRFQKIIQTGEALTQGGTMNGNHDFTGFVPISGSSSNGYLSINKENTPGGVTVLDVSLNADMLWVTSLSEDLDFTNVGGTARNCSGTVTSWGTVITCEETTSADNNMDGYNDLGWCVEIDPANKSVLNKLWAVGNFAHENIVIHPNNRTAYLGADSNPGYLFKFVADVGADLSTGNLFVYKGSKSGAGNWIQLNNTTQTDRNTTLSQCSALEATVFNGVEDVEIGNDGLVYFAVKGEDRVYRFQDSDPIAGTVVPDMETYVGGMSYEITHENGVSLVPWGTGNDNLAFDGEGNLWVTQDGSDNYIWVVKSGHTQSNPKVEIFGRSPQGSEPTGITFSPDFKYLFMSIQHPSSGNNSSLQLDASGLAIGFEEDISLVIARAEHLGVLCVEVGTPCDDNDESTFDDVINVSCECEGTPILQTTSWTVSSSNDDIEENTSTGNISAASSDLEMTYEAQNDITQIVGLRFEGVVVPDGKIIEDAYIQFTVDERDSEMTDLLIQAKKTANAVPFDISNNGELSSMFKTNASVAWTDIPAWNSVGEAGARQRTPNLAEIINEISKETNWISGNSMAFIISGSGVRVAESYDGNPDLAPKLVIRYVEPNKNNVGISSENPLAKLEVNQGDVFVKSLGSGVITKSPDGKCWRFVVSNEGEVSAVNVACPE